MGLDRPNQYYTGTAEFEFGDGLSYDTWEIDWETPPVLGATTGAVELTTAAGSGSRFSVDVSNTGTFGGGCTILGFWRPVGGALTATALAGSPRAPAASTRRGSTMRTAWTLIPTYYGQCIFLRY